ncbi:MAG TPA: hypothetical protein V6C97_07285 [Oculatellaceae cyanobacterium]
MARIRGKSSDRILTPGASLIASMCLMTWGLVMLSFGCALSVFAADGAQAAVGATSSKSQPTVIKPAAPAGKPATVAKVEPKSVPAKIDAKSGIATKAAPSQAAPAAKAVAKTDPKAESKTDSKSDPKNDSKIQSKTEAKAESKGEAKADPKTAHAHVKVHPAPALVPPPPPDTPTMMIPSFGDESTSLMPMEYMSPQLLKKRKDDLVAQLSDAKSELKLKQDDVDNVKQRAEQFKTLFEEGVISKRELEAAQKEASEIDSSVNRAQLRVSELQTLLDGVNGRWDQINNKNKKKAVIKRLSDKASRTH